MVREAARWGLRQTLLDDRGWNEVYSAYAHGGDITREQIAATLIMRADAVMTWSACQFSAADDYAESDDESRPESSGASLVGARGVELVDLESARADGAQRFVSGNAGAPEPNVLVENAQRYQTQALFIANGHRAKRHQRAPVLELIKLFEAISKKLDRPNPTLVKTHRGRRRHVLQHGGGDGGPGQMGYTTEHSKDLVGKAVVAY